VIYKGLKPIPKRKTIVPHSTCPSLSPSPPRTQLHNRSCSNKHTLQTLKIAKLRSRRH
jgi:hypothetical protein